MNRTIYKKLAPSPEFQAHSAHFNQQAYNDFKVTPCPDDKAILRLKTKNPYDPSWISLYKQTQDLQKRAPKQAQPPLSAAALKQLIAKLEEAKKALPEREGQRTPSPIAQAPAHPRRSATPIEIDESKVAVKKPSPKHYVALADPVLEEERKARQEKQQNAWNNLIKKVDDAIQENENMGYNLQICPLALSDDEKNELRKNKEKLNRDQRFFLHPILRVFKQRT